MYSIVDAAGKVSRSQVRTFTQPRDPISILEELKLSTTLQRNSQTSGYTQKEANIQIAVEADGIRELLNTTINLASCVQPSTKTITLQQEPLYVLTYKIRICLQEQLRRASQQPTKRVQFAMLSPTKKVEEANSYGMLAPKEIRSANFIEDHLSPRQGLASSKSAKSIGQEGEHKKRANSQYSKGVDSVNSTSVKCVQKHEEPLDNMEQKIVSLEKDSRELKARIAAYEGQMMSLREEVRKERAKSHRWKGELEQLQRFEKLKINGQSKAPLEEKEARKLREHLGYLEGFQLELKTENQMLEEDLQAKNQKIKQMLILAAEAEKKEVNLKNNLSELYKKNEQLERRFLKANWGPVGSAENAYRGVEAQKQQPSEKEGLVQTGSNGRCKMCLELGREIERLQEAICKLNNPNESTTNQQLLQNEILLNKLKRQLEISIKNERNLLIQKSQVEMKCKNWEGQMMKSKMALARIVNAVQEAGSQELKEEINQLIL